MAATATSFVVLSLLTVLLPARNFLPSDSLLVESFASFAPQYALLALALAAWQLCRRRWLRATAFLLLLVPEVTNAWRGAPNLPASAVAPVMTVYSANLFESPRAVRAAVAEAERLEPDIIWWSEFPSRLDPETDARVAALDARYPFGFEQAAYDGRDLRFLSKHPLRARQSFTPPRTSGRPALRLTLEVRGKLLTVFALHTHPPTSGWSLEARNQTLAWLESELRGHYGNALVLGDLNTSAFSPRFRELIHGSGLRCASPWRCAVASWPAFFPPLMTPIDHILARGGVHVVNLRRGRFTGSDHFPVIAEVVFE